MTVQEYGAGRDLDRLVHERVFGGRVDHRWIRWGENLYRTCFWCGGRYRVDREPQPRGCDTVPPFSSDIAAAWDVVDQARASFGHDRWRALCTLLANGPGRISIRSRGGGPRGKLFSGPNSF